MGAELHTLCQGVTLRRMETPEQIPEVEAEPLQPGDEPDGEIEEDEPVPFLPIGPAFALNSEGTQFLPRDNPETRAKVPGASQGSIATIVCTCGSPFVLSLITDKPKHCPHCNQEFTSILVVAPVDDHEIAMDMLGHLQMQNEPETPSAEGIPEAD